MARWATIKLTLPEALQQITDLAAELSGAATAVLDVNLKLAQAEQALLTGFTSAYRSAVNVLITELQNILMDIKNSGLYVFVDYPLSINKTTRQGTERPLLDPLKWEAPIRDLRSYDEAIGRIISAFDDPQDPLRPQFSRNANTVGVVLLAHTSEISTVIRIMNNLSNLLSIDHLSVESFSVVGRWVQGIKKDVTQMTESDWLQVDLSIPHDLKPSSGFPDFVAKTTIGDVFPGIGEGLEAAATVLDGFRPTGEITALVNQGIENLEEQIRYLQNLVDELVSLTQQLRDAFSGTEISAVVIESASGDEGFKEALRTARGAPQFDDDFVVSVLLYAGGPGATFLKEVFSNSVGDVQTSISSAVAKARDELNRPTVKP
jgi:hypothetical protein